jgi:hypothetical protein
MLSKSGGCDERAPLLSESVDLLATQPAHAAGVIDLHLAVGNSSWPKVLMKAVNMALSVLLGLTLGGCATIISGKSQIMVVNSNVDDAEVHLISGEGETLLGITPLNIRLERGQEGTLRVRAEGYRPYQAALNKKINPVFFVNILSGGVFGSTTDYATGAMYEYEPSTYMVTLQPANQSPEQREAWVRREGLRGFVLQNSQAVVADLAAGQGEYIDVLVHVLTVAPENRSEAIERWRAGYASSKTALRFAETLVAELDR